MAATTTTDRSDSGRSGEVRRPGEGTSIAAVAIAVLLACTGLALSIPRLGAALTALNGEQVFEDLQRDGALPRDRVEAAAAALAAANAWNFDGRREARRGILLYLRAKAMPPGEARLTAAAEAAGVLENALRSAPGQPAAWALLGRVRDMRGDTAGAVEAVRASILAGTVEPRIMAWRLGTALQHYPLLNEEMRAMVTGQIRLLWVVAPADIAGLAQTPAYGPVIAQALSTLSRDEIDRLLRHRADK